MGWFDRIESEEKKLKERKIEDRKSNPFDNAVFDEGEFVTIHSQVTIEPVVEEKPDGGTDSRPSLPE